MTELLCLHYDVWQKPLVNACTLQYYHNLKANDEMMTFTNWNNKGWSTLSKCTHVCHFNFFDIYYCNPNMLYMSVTVFGKCVYTTSTL